MTVRRRLWGAKAALATSGLATLIIAYLLRSGRQSARGGAMAEALALDTAAAQA